MCLNLYKALERTAMSESCSRLGCSNLSKLKPYFKPKSCAQLRARAAETLEALAPKVLVGEQDGQVNDAREAITGEEGALAEERVARVATAVLLPEAHEAHARSYVDGERDASASKQEEGERQKAHEGAQGSQYQHETEGGDDQEGWRCWGRRTDAHVHLLTYLGQSL